MYSKEVSALFHEALRPTWLEIDLDVLAENLRQVISLTGDVDRIIAILKGDGYGYGAVNCAKVLTDQGVRHFGVATLKEAEELRLAAEEEDCPALAEADILLLGLTPPPLAEDVVRLNVMPVVDSPEQARALGAAAEKAGTSCRALLALDTGMGRIGLLAEDASSINDAKAIAATPGLELKGIFSHLSTADDADDSFCDVQIPRYERFLEQCREAGIAEGWDWNTLASSPSILKRPENYYDKVRCGSLLFGHYPEDRMDFRPIPLSPVLRWPAYFTKIKTVPAGTPISYSRRFTTQRESRIGTLPFGTADGYPRTALNNSCVLVRGHKVPLVGTLCMDQSMVDLTDFPDVSLEDEVLVVGRDGDAELDVDDIARAAGLSRDEVICDLTMRMPRRYLYKGESWWEKK